MKRRKSKVFEESVLAQSGDIKKAIMTRIKRAQCRAIDKVGEVTGKNLVDIGPYTLVRNWLLLGEAWGAMEGF